SLMLGWLDEVTFGNGDMLLMNDSAEGIAPSVKQLYDYAALLGVKPNQISLRESGFRKIKKEKYQILVDFCSMPKLNAGHAHADALHFILYIKGKPLLIDTGISTYENNPTRKYERSTAAHNTVTIDRKNQSDVYNTFR